MNVLLLGPVPTPAVGFLVRSMGADVGVMISASHNPHEDNGVKFFGPNGFKLSDEAEAAIEAIMAGDNGFKLAEAIRSASVVPSGWKAGFRAMSRICNPRFQLTSTFPA